MTFMSSAVMTGLMSGFDADQRRWLRNLLEKHNLNATDLARRAGLNPSTLTRFLQGERDGHMLSQRTVKKIEEVTSRSAPPSRSSFEEDAHLYDPAAVSGSFLYAAIEAMKSGRNGLDAWVIGTDDLEGIRLYRGDVLLVDQNVEAKAGDLVCAQIVDWKSNTARTAFRLYQPPYLLAGSLSPRLRQPEVPDGRNITIRGVVMARLSPRDMLNQVQ